MNFNRFKQNVGMHVQLVPVACRLDEFGMQLPSVDDDWLITDITDEYVRISNAAGYVIDLGTDHIHHFTSNPDRSRGQEKFGFLTLHVQIFLQGCNSRLRPNLRPGETVAPPPVQIVDKIVDPWYLADSGLEQKLAAAGYKIMWSVESNLSRRIDLDGWQILIEQDSTGNLVRFRIKDRRDDLVLIKRHL